MSRMEKTPLDQWVAEKINLKPGQALTPGAICRYQEHKLAELFNYAKEKSSFYRELYQHIEPSAITSLPDLAKLPLISSRDLIDQGSRMVCVPQGEINRIVTLETTGTTGQPKRVYFTAADQELTIDFFHRGMLTLIDESDHLLILLPWQRPGSVGDLLQKGVSRLGAEVTCYGLVDDPSLVIKLIRDKGITSLVGIPVQVLSLVYAPGGDKAKLNNVLLSTDYVADSLKEQIRKRWGCPVFEHYGMTETGLGGAVSCQAQAGYHPRVADLIFEIIDPETGVVHGDGNEAREQASFGEKAPLAGEIVVTTLTRRGMPVIRYRTGDWGRWQVNPCACGSALPVLDKVKGRLAGDYSVLGQRLNLVELDELIFALDGVIDYESVLVKEDGRERIAVQAFTAAGDQRRPDRLMLREVSLNLNYVQYCSAEVPLYRKRILEDKRGIMPLTS